LDKKVILNFIILFIFVALFGSTLFLMWRVRKLEKEHIKLTAMVVGAANLLYELSKVSSIMQQGILDHAKAVGLSFKYNKETQNELIELKTNVEKFVAAMAQQIQFLHLATKSQKATAVFGPVKKNDKIKPN